MATAEILEPVSAPPRYHSLDGLRAAMMFLGIVIHAAMPYISFLAPYLPFNDPKAQSDSYGLITFSIHTFRMPIFFVMAGFFGALLYDRRGARSLMVNRFQRVALPFAIGWIIAFPVIQESQAYFKAGGGSAGLRAAKENLLSGQIFENLNPTYLWFLYYLFFYYPAALALIAIARRFAPSWIERTHRAFRWTMLCRLRAFLFAIPTAITLIPMDVGEFDTPITFAPYLRVFAAYGPFFGFGWLLYRNADLLPSLTRDAWKQLTLGLFLMPFNLVGTIIQLDPKSPILGIANAFTIVTSALMTWLLTFGITGLFLKYLHRPSATRRYLTDASYWCYLVHYPMIYWCAALVASWPLISFGKYIAVIALTTTISLISYHLFCRSTVIGVWLNGRSYPFRFPRTKHELPTREPLPVTESTGSILLGSTGE